MLIRETKGRSRLHMGVMPRIPWCANSCYISLSEAFSHPRKLTRDLASIGPQTDFPAPTAGDISTPPFGILQLIAEQAQVVHQH